MAGLDRVLQTEQEAETTTAEMRASAAVESAYTYTAQSWLEYLQENYGIPRQDICIVFHTDSTGALSEAEIILRKCGFSQRENVEKELNALWELPIKVHGKGGTYG